MGSSPSPTVVDSQRQVALARITSPFGVRGWVKAMAFTESAADVLEYRDWELVWPDGRRRNLRLLEGRLHGKGLALHFESINDRDVALTLAQAEMQVERGTLPPLARGEYYRDDLLDFEVVNLQGEALGRLDHYVDTPANAVMVVMSDRERWLPLTPHCLMQVDVEGRRLVVDWDRDF